MNIVGDVRGKNCLIIDDMCDTGGTICKVAEALAQKRRERDLRVLYARAFCRATRLKISSSSHLKKVIVTNTIPLCEKGKALEDEGRIEVLSVAKLLASESNQFTTRPVFRHCLFKFKARSKVMADKVVVKAEKREGRGKNDSRRLARAKAKFRSSFTAAAAKRSRRSAELKIWRRFCVPIRA